MKKLATDIPGLDTLLRGGIPVGRATLILGQSGAGKTLAALELAINAAREGVGACFHSFEERADDLIDSAESLGLDPKPLLDAGRLHIDYTRLPMGESVDVSGALDVASTARRLAKDARERGAELLVLDSLSVLFAGFDGLGRRHFFAFVEALIDEELTVVLTADANLQRERRTRYGHEDAVCDLVLILRQKTDGRRRRRTVEVHKYRRSSHLQGEFPMVVTREGVVVFPLDAQEEAREASPLETTRYASGVPGLDELTGGGWQRGRCVLLRGEFGCGKTIFAGCHAAAALARGETVIYLGFEESQSMLLYNWETVGIELRPYLERKKLHMAMRLPEGTSPEDLIIELRGALDRYAPSLIVVDSISAIEHAVSVEGFRHFMAGVMSSARSRGTSTLLTQTVASSARAGAPYVSTAADAVVELGSTGMPGMHRRYLRVAKMRGARHDLQFHALSIGQTHPMRVEGPLAVTDDLDTGR